MEAFEYVANRIDENYKVINNRTMLLWFADINGNSGVHILFWTLFNVAEISGCSFVGALKKPKCAGILKSRKRWGTVSRRR
jgi:hypothetical protein